MALTPTDWSVAANGNIREVAGTSTHEVIELHRWLMDLFDNSVSTGDDLLDVTTGIIPSTRKTDEILVLNSPYNVDDTVVERFYNGSIEQDGGDTLYSGLKVVGKTENASTQLQLVQNGALLTNYWTTGINVDAANNILLQMMVKSRTGGADIDGKRLRVQCRETGYEFAYFEVTLGNAVATAAIFSNADDFNDTADGVVSGWTTIVNVPGYQALDVDSDSVDEYYYSKWTRAAYTVKQLYERSKWATRRGTSETIHGINGELFLGITHSWDYDNESGAFTETETLSWGTGATAGTGVLLGLKDDGLTGTMYIQLMTGVPPVTTMEVTGGTSLQTCDVDGAPTARTVNAKCFLGNFSGNLAGAYGAGVITSELTASDSLRALDNTARNPPNWVTITATGVVSGDILFAAETKTHSTTASGAHSLGDTTLTLATALPATYGTIGRVVVDGEEHIYTAVSAADLTIAAPGLKSALVGGETVTVTQIYDDRFTVDAVGGDYNGIADTKIQMTASIGLAWPAAGYVRVWNTASGWHEVYSYTSISGQQLLGVSPALSRDINGETAFIPYADEAASGITLSKSIVYPGSDVTARWRLYNSASLIVPFEVPFTIGSTGSSSQMVRASDA